MSKLSFLVSTRGENISRLKDLFTDIQNQTYRNIEVVIVLQPLNETIEELVRKQIETISVLPVKLVLSDTIGLSKSRNIAISNASGDYLLLCDDDCRYPSSAAASIAQAMAAYPDWDIISFQMADSDTGKLYKKYPPLAVKHTLRSLMHVNSVEIVLRNNLRGKIPLFDERIGLGTPYFTGGENVMLLDTYKQKTATGFYPRTIVIHPIETSGRGHGINSAELDQLILSKGVMFRRMFGLWGILPALAFFLRRLFPGKALRFRPTQFSHLFRGLLIRL